MAMSLLDLIVSQKIILITVGLGVLMFLAAAAVAVVPRIRHRAKKAALQKAAAQSSARSASEVISPAQQRKASAAQPSPALQASGAEKAPAGNTPTGKVPAGNILVEKPPVIQAAATPATASTTQPEVSPAMRDILSSVFEDDESNERYAALMDGLDKVDIQALATLAGKLSRERRALGSPAHQKEA
jgi:hypothetical protein